MRYVVGTVVILLGAAYLLTGVVQVQPGERAVVYRFGRVLPDKSGPGLHIGLPRGMDRVERVPVDLERPVTVGYPVEEDEIDINTPPGQLLSGDNNLVNVRVVIAYHVREGQIDDYVVHKDKVDGLVERVADAALAEWVAGRNVDYILGQGKRDLPNWLVGQVQERITPYELGIEIDRVNEVYLFPPRNVKRDFDEVTRADTGKKTAMDQARAQAGQDKQVAQSEGQRVLDGAKADASAQQTQAHADAGRFLNRLQKYQEYQKTHPGNGDYLNSIWWDEMGLIFAQMKNNGQLDLLDHYLGKDGLDITQFAPLPKKQ